MPGSLARGLRARFLDPIADLIARRLEASISERIASLLVDLQERSKALNPSGSPRQPTDREYVEWAYRLLLGREPGIDPEELAAHPYASDHARLVYEFLNSDEFHARFAEKFKFNLSDLHRPAYFLTELDDGLRFWVNLRDEQVSRGIIHGMWEETETLFVRRHIKSGMNVLDIGANLGWFTVQMSRLVGSSGRVISFEPRSDLFHYLAKTVEENKMTNIVLFNCALGARSDEAYLHWHKEDTNPGGSQLVPAEMDPESLGTASIIEKVMLRTIDELLDQRPVDFIKIDVEGSEKFVWDGAKRVLAKDRPIILSEVNATDLRLISRISVEEYLQYFEDRGYIPRLIGPTGAYGAKIKGESIDWHDDVVVSVALIPVEKE